MEGRQAGDETDRSLDFGWFKVPPATHDDKTNASAGGGEPTSVAMGGAADGTQGSRPASSMPCQQQVRPPSNACQQRPPSNACNQRPPTNAGMRPPSNSADGRPMSQSQAIHCTAEEAEGAFNRITEQGCYEAPQPPTAYDENIVIDWPLSNVGEEQVQRFPKPMEGKNQQLQNQSNRPSTSCKRLETPLPPLNLQGYGQDRPTYSTWRDKWHKEQQRFLDSNNNNNNNSSNNNVTSSSRNNTNNNAGTSCPSSEIMDTIDIETDPLSGHHHNSTAFYTQEDLQTAVEFQSSRNSCVVENENECCTRRKRRGFQFHAADHCYQNIAAYTHEAKVLPKKFPLSYFTVDETEEDSEQDRKQSIRQIITDRLKRITRWSRCQGAKVEDSKMAYYNYDKLNPDPQN